MSATSSAYSDSSSVVEPVFHLFDGLPIEVRFTIWEFSLPDERIIEIKWEERTNEYYTHCPTPFIFRICQESRQVARRVFDLLEFKNNVDVDMYEADIYETSDAGDEQVKSEEDEAGENSDDEAEGEGSSVSADEGKSDAEDSGVTKFQVYINYDRDMLMFHEGHLARLRHFNDEGEVERCPALHAFLWRLLRIPAAAEKLQSVSVEPYGRKQFAVGPPLFEFKNLKKITLLYGDGCCVSFGFDRDCARATSTKPIKFVEAGLADAPWNSEDGWPIGQESEAKTYIGEAHEFKEKFEVEIMRYKEIHGYEDSSHVDEWKDLEVVARWTDKGRSWGYEAEWRSDSEEDDV